MTGDAVSLRPITRICRFGIVGGGCFVVQLGLLHLLDGFMHLYYADVVAFLASAQVNFVLSLLFTWGDRRHEELVRLRWLKFNANALVSVFLVNASVFYLLVHLGLPYWAAMLAANVASSVWTFLVNHLIVFKAQPTQPKSLTTPEKAIMRTLPVDTSHSPSVALFMPAYNEAANLGDVIARAHRFFDEAGISERAVIVVDDGSSDGTAAVLAEFAASQAVSVVTHDGNQGYGRALRSGFAAALATGCEWVAFCDSDGQFNPGDMALLMVTAYTHHVDVVLGVRLKRADNVVRRIAGRGWHLISRMVLKYDATDVDCGFKLLHRSAIEAVVPELRSDYAAISPELLARLHRAGTRCVEVPVPHYPRAHGTQSGLQPKVVLRSFRDLYLVRRELAVRAVAPVPSALQAYLPVAGQEAV
ncbi:glycosyltransferase [Mycobacterium sp. ITM-2016-00317]|uniref:glycosyltransferase n=1 Tax=Mycobacterium sp. ITM-2016-00317 TaxID=2099694 RepID=UPI00287FB6BD|nr:glycosyltransferase [Mycobacterium sp. ITM-2016-00317]WNG86273.1 glycosyltransferase [Mycobacterium sp. ITM-2016-00317]